MSRIQPRPAADLPDFDLIFKGTAELLGETPNSTLIMGHKPGLLGTFYMLAGTLFHKMGGGISLPRLKMTMKTLGHARRSDPPNEVDEGLQHLVSYAASLSAGCRYCQAHTAFSTETAGVPTEKLEDILNYDTSPHYTPAERAAVALAFAAGRVPNAATDDHFVELRKYFTEGQMVEILFVISLFGFLNRWNDTLATSLEGAPKQFAERHLAKTGWEAGKHAR